MHGDKACIERAPDHVILRIPRKSVREHAHIYSTAEYNPEEKKQIRVCVRVQNAHPTRQPQKLLANNTHTHDREFN